MSPEERERVSAKARHRRAIREKNLAEEAGRFVNAMLALGKKGDRLWADAAKAIPRVKQFPTFAGAAWMAAYCGHDPDKILTIAKLLLPGRVKP